MPTPARKPGHARRPRARNLRSNKQDAAIAILRTADAVRSHLARVVEPYGVTLQQYNVLRILRGAHPQPLPTLVIGDRLIERVPGITRLLDRLEEKGLVRRERSTEDRRLVHCSITDEGLELLAMTDVEVNAADAWPARSLAQSEVSTLIRLLDRVRTGLEP